MHKADVVSELKFVGEIDAELDEVDCDEVTEVEEADEWLSWMRFMRPRPFSPISDGEPDKVSKVYRELD